MTRGTWVFRDGKLVPKHLALQQEWKSIAKRRSHLPAPAVISDNMQGFVSHVDGKTYFDSKSAWTKHVRAAGCEIVGNDLPTPKPRFDERQHRKDVEADVALAFQMHEQGYEAPPLERASEFDVEAIAADAHKSPDKTAYVHADPESLVSGKTAGPAPRRGGGRKSKRGK